MCKRYSTNNWIGAYRLTYSARHHYFFHSYYNARSPTPKCGFEYQSTVYETLLDRPRSRNARINSAFHAFKVDVLFQRGI